MEKINSFIVTKAFSVTLEKLNKNSQAWCPPPYPLNFVEAFFFSPHPHAQKLAARSLNRRASLQNERSENVWKNSNALTT